MSKNTTKALLAVALCVTACGQDNGYLYRPQNVQFMDKPAEPLAFGLTPINYSQVTWYYDCVDPSAPAPAATRPQELVLTGPGPHHVARTRMIDTPIVFKGRVCPARVYDRDVAIGIRTAGSMFWNDPLVPATNSCKRLDALRQIAGSIPAGSKVAAYSFTELGEVMFKTGFVSNANDLFAEIVSQALAASRDANSPFTGRGDLDSIEKAVCYSYGGETFADAANFGKTLLESGRANDTKKELILITDDWGAGNGFNAVNRVFTDMKTNGVTAAGQTLPVKVGIVDVGGASASQPRLVEFASVDANNQPIKKPDAAQVSSAMAEFAVNRLTSAIFQYSEIGATSMTQVNVLPTIQNNSFELPSVQVAEVGPNQTGYQVKFDFADTHGNAHSFEGKIEWSDF